MHVGGFFKEFLVVEIFYLTRRKPPSGAHSSSRRSSNSFDPKNSRTDGRGANEALIVRYCQIDFFKIKLVISIFGFIWSEHCLEIPIANRRNFINWRYYYHYHYNYQCEGSDIHGTEYPDFKEDQYYGSAGYWNGETKLV